MKRNIFKSILILIIGFVFFSSCSDSFLDVPPKGTSLESNFYKTESDAYGALVGVYDLLRKNSGGFENMITMMNAGSDDQYAGGGGETDGIGIQSFSNYKEDPNTMPQSFWSDYYIGITRANILLKQISNITLSDANKARYTAEVKALRGFYYFNLVIMFKNIPLILEPLTPVNTYDVVQATPEAVYTQIEKDLNEAIPNLPTTVTSAEKGRLTKAAAQAILGKVYLYEKKYSQAVAMLAEVNGTPGATSQYGNKLLSNFADLWEPANKFNSESILETCHTSVGSSYWGIWGGSNDEGNTVNVMVGPRGYVKTGNDAPDLPSGWSFNVFTQDFYDFMKDDPRFASTLLDVKALNAAGQCKYVAGYKDTGYFLNKFLPRTKDVTTGTGDAVLNYRQNSYIIRLADTYLMEAEALGATGTRAQALLDAVRSRVGLASVPVTLKAIKDERRRELAGEGFRFFDLVRWGDAATVLASRGFVAGKNEIFPIPIRETQNTKINQNPNY